jgi:hypothetical protein
MTEHTVELVFKIPSKDEKGYLRRMKRAGLFSEAFKSGEVTGKLFDDMVSFLADYVIQPNNRDEAIEAIWDASEAQIVDLLEALTETGKVNPQSGGS